MLAVLMMLVSSLCFSACKDIVKVEVKFQAYNYEKAEMYEDGEISLTIELYRHLAKETVDSVIKNINDGLYNNALVYKIISNKNQYMIGDLKYDDNGNIIQVNAPEVKGEFASNGVSGSNLKFEKGTIGLWRSYYACDSGVAVSSSARDTGRATLFLPTEASSIYQDHMCVFGKVDFEDDKAETVYDVFEALFDDSERYLEYMVYYTGEYDETKADENYGLTFNIELADEYDEDKIENLFKTDDQEQQLKCYDAYKIQVPVVARNGLHSLKVASVTIK
jgi:cyclophilin family peptidyl-prolyl cis-trans isomerase